MRLRALKPISFAALALATVAASAQGKPTQCGQCHTQALSQPLTDMGQALKLPAANATLHANPKLTFQRGAYRYSVETHDGQSTYTVTDGTQTASVPIKWTFGANAQTWLLERDGQLYESLVSYYPAIKGLDITTGDEKLAPKSLNEAVGREITDSEAKVCFGCHSSSSIVHDKLDLTSVHPGVTCEHCHTGASAHTADISRGITDTIPPRLRSLSAEETSNFCGQCHRTWETVVRNHWSGPVDVRFQPYRLANSRCFDGTDPRISCVACHDPHKQLVRDAAYYDGKCLACHAGTLHVGSAPAPKEAKSCPVAKANCVSCHMPKVPLPNGHLTFTDHDIRVVKAGAPYPN